MNWNSKNLDPTVSRRCVELGQTCARTAIGSTFLGDVDIYMHLEPYTVYHDALCFLPPCFDIVGSLFIMFRLTFATIVVTRQRTQRRKWTKRSQGRISIALKLLVTRTSVAIARNTNTYPWQRADAKAPIKHQAPLAYLDRNVKRESVNDQLIGRIWFWACHFLVRTMNIPAVMEDHIVDMGMAGQGSWAWVRT